MAREDTAEAERGAGDARIMEGKVPCAMKVSATLPLLYLSLVYVGNHTMVMDLVRYVVTMVHVLAHCSESDLFLLGLPVMVLSHITI